MAHRSLVLAALGATSLACAGLRGEPVPVDRRDLIGSWSAVGIDLEVSPTGDVHYAKNSGTGLTSLDGPVTEWTDDGFVVGVFGVGTTFRIDEAPHQVEDHWETVIDGMTLSRPLPEAERMPQRRRDRHRQ